MSASSLSGVVIRHATREDVPSVLSFIHALALYEKEPSAVKATESSLLSSLSFDTPSSTPSSQNLEPISPSRPARALLLYPPSSSTAVGLAIYVYNYSTWRSKPGIYLEDLFVNEEERGKGYGTMLLGRLAEEVLAVEGGRLEWSVLRWNEPSIGFYKTLGAKELGAWVGMRVEGGEALEGLVERGRKIASGSRK